MRAVSGPEPDPEAGDPKAVAVRVKPAKRWAHPVILQRIKADPLLATWDLIRLPRLSVVAVSPEQWQRLEELAAADTG
jgi:predicted RNA-binding protein with PUA-like domain